MEWLKLQAIPHAVIENFICSKQIIKIGPQFGRSRSMSDYRTWA